MKNKCNLLVLIIISALSCLSACKKSGSEDNGSFTWNYKGVDYTAKYTLARSVEDLGPNIIGGLGNAASTPGSGPSFKIEPFAVGLYAVGPGENPVSFTDTAGNNLPAVGLLTITSTANKKLSGTFILEIGVTGDQHTLTGVIKNIPIAP
ncbi:MAG: hypothetical protein H7Y86_06370 [Rhizobacter sp.]|nr:hypothetical protein [Ferruginibacter sp.]